MGLAVLGLLVTAPPSGAGLLGGGDDGGGTLNIGGRVGVLVGGGSGGTTGGGLGGVVSGLTGTVSSVTGNIPIVGPTVAGVTNTLGGTLSGVTSTLGNVLTGAGLSGITAATPTAGTYQPPLHDIGNPHGEGTVATAMLGANLLPGLGGPGGEVVVGRALGEYQATTTKQFHGHITVLSLFGSEILGVDSTPGQTNSLPLTAQQTLNNICATSIQTICLNVLAATSQTTNVSSINHFEAAGLGIGGIAGLSADAAYSDGNITVDPVTGCETTLGDSHVANIKLGALTVVGAVDSTSGGATCNDPKSPNNVAPHSLSQVVTLLGTPLGLPIVAPNPGCSSGGPASSFGSGMSGVPNTDAGIPLLLPIICNADDTNGLPTGTKQDANIPYSVREALTAFVLQLSPATALAKVSAGDSQVSVTAPGSIGTTTASTTTGTTTTSTGTTTTSTGTTTTSTGTTTTSTGTTTTSTGTTTTSTGTTTTSTGTTTTSTGTTTTSTGVPGSGNNSTPSPSSTGNTPNTAGTTGKPGSSTGTTNAVTTSSEKLPFTGLNVLWLLLGGVTMVALGTGLRHFGARRNPAE